MNPAEIGLTHEQFLRRIPTENRERGRDDSHQGDYGLIRLVAANCALQLDDDGHDVTPTLVVKGGFAIRHLYGGARRSKDADLSMLDPDLEMEGPKLLRLPTDMAIAREEVGNSVESWRIHLTYRRTDRRSARIRCDLNDRARSIRRLPPQKRQLVSLYIDAFDVWAATIEEIVGEKIYALLDQPDIRAKDIFDIRHVLRDRAVAIDGQETLIVYAAIRDDKRKGPQIVDIRTCIAAVPGNLRAVAAWQIDVLDALPDAGSIKEAVDEVVDLLGERVF